MIVEKLFQYYMLSNAEVFIKKYFIFNNDQLTYK